MKSTDKSKTKLSQRVIIWIIAIVMGGGTILTYVVVIVAQQDPASDPTQIAYQKYLKNLEEQQAKVDATSTCQSVARDNPLVNIDTYKAEAFDNNVTELKVETLQDGTGEPATADNCVDVNYKGWNTKGEIFDSGSYAVVPSSGLVIPGWSVGLVGLKVGGIYKLTIPAEMAYGETGSGDKIPPNEPLVFIIEVVSNT
jgi:FKBP-type peptidyl-prolyl cis-trans isomerase